MNHSQISKISDSAINAAISNNWQQAVDLYKKILKIDPHHLDSLLGLAYAYLHINDFKNAKKTYNLAIKIDPTNMIASSNLDKIKTIEKKGKKTIEENPNKIIIDPNMFLNVAGKTKLSGLNNIGQIDVIAKLKIGEEVYLKIKKRRVEIRNHFGEYIGVLPDDISKRLIYFLQAKTKYRVYIKSASKNSVEVFIKEDKKTRKVARYLSFPKNIQDDLKLMISSDEDLDPADQENEKITKDELDDTDDDEDDKDIKETDIEWLAENKNDDDDVIAQDEDDSSEFEE